MFIEVIYNLNFFENKPYMLVITKCTIVIAGCPDLRETILDLNSGY